MKNSKYFFFVCLFILVGILMNISTPVKAEVVNKTESQVGIYFEEDMSGKDKDLSSTMIDNTKNKLRLPQTGELRFYQKNIIGLLLIFVFMILIKKKKRKEDI